MHLECVGGDVTLMEVRLGEAPDNIDTAFDVAVGKKLGSFVCK
jgi:hypothetical protein